MVVKAVVSACQGMQQRLVGMLSVMLYQSLQALCYAGGIEEDTPGVAGHVEPRRMHPLADVLGETAAEEQDGIGQGDRVGEGMTG